MLTDDKTKLLIFEDFRVDENLPKFRPPELPPLELPDEVKAMPGAAATTKYLEAMQERRSQGAVDRSWRPGGVVLRQARIGGFREGTLIQATMPGERWFLRLARMTGDAVKDAWAKLTQPPPEVAIPALFNAVKMTALELEMLDKVDLGYTEAIERAQANGQTALVEELKNALEGVRAEAWLLALGHARYLTEEAVVEFALNCPKGLRLDWVENFARAIPGEITEKKVQLDARGIFDNYVVLHYDPGVKAYRETEAQKAARRDPILFGVMRGRRRLYFIGDWIDEVCDLTWDQIAAQIGAEKTSALALEALMPKRAGSAGSSGAPKSEQA